MFEDIRLIVGLSNPGLEYAKTRHNIGSWLVDLIAKKYKVNLIYNNKFFGFYAKFKFKDKDVFLLNPQTYMNLSGKSVAALAGFYKFEPNQILVAHDELDFAPGIIKLKFGGSSGGHNGLKDLERVIGKYYWRFRLGIGHPGDKNKVTNYVLKPPLSDEVIVIDQALNKANSVIELILSGKLNEAMKIIHTKPTI